MTITIKHEIPSIEVNRRTITFPVIRQPSDDEIAQTNAAQTGLFATAYTWQQGGICYVAFEKFEEVEKGARLEAY